MARALLIALLICAPCAADAQTITATAAAYRAGLYEWRRNAKDVEYRYEEQSRELTLARAELAHVKGDLRDSRSSSLERGILIGVAALALGAVIGVLVGVGISRDDTLRILSP